MEYLPDHLAVVEDKETGLFHGAYFRNIPTPSGCNRFWLHTTTSEGFTDPEAAADAISRAYPDMPRPDDTTNLSPHDARLYYQSEETLKAGRP